MEENKNTNEEIIADASEVTEETKAEETKAEEPSAEEVKSVADELVEKIKKMVKEGNVSRIRIRKDDLIVLNLPVNVGIVGTMIGLAAAPWAVVLATITTIGLNCTVEVEKKDGTVTIIHGKESK